MTKKNINNILSNRKSKTKISKINPSNRLISQKMTVQGFMKPVHTHGAPQPILGFISNNMFFHTVSACASKLR